MGETAPFTVFLSFQVEPNARKIEEHRKKYQRMHKEREIKMAERERQKQAEARVNIVFAIFYSFVKHKMLAKYHNFTREEAWTTYRI